MNAQDIRIHVSAYCSDLGLSMWAEEHCVVLGQQFQIFGAENPIEKAKEMARVIADELRMAEA